MNKFYIISNLVTPVILAIILFVWGMEEKVENERTKKYLSRIIYYWQFCSSIAAIFIIPNNSIVNYTMIHLKDYHIDLTFLLNTQSFIIATVISLVFIIVEKLSFNYLHAEEEHSKFYGLKLFLNYAIMSFIFSTNIDFLFFNWEIIGISSALLISYFYRRNQAVEHSIFAFSVYRICDASFMMSALFLFYFYNTEDIGHLAGGTPALVLSILIFIAIMGKSGVWPFSSWLPLALEGPTPSSNLYYMTLSTHMGVILMMKTATLWESSLVGRIIMICALVLNIFITTTSARVQTSIKGSIAYSALAQVSLILIEVILGFHTLALIHMSSHILYRLAQTTNSPSIIDQHNLIERFIGENMTSRDSGIFYFQALNGFGSEKIVKTIFSILIAPFVFLDKIENRLLHIYTDEEKLIKVLSGEVKSE